MEKPQNRTDDDETVTEEEEEKEEMSGVRRRTKYRKSTLRSVTDEFPEPDENEYIVMALGSRGSNIFEVRMSFFV